jgi:uncharacterized protein (TIGR03085 family)
MSVAQRERAALVETLRKVGADAPTLCGSWTARDLAAHLVVREYRPDAAPGIAIPALARYTAKVQNHAAESTDWEVLLAKLAAGPPLYSPLKFVDALANVAEMFVHHEDVRRAVPGWQPRELDATTMAALRRPIPMVSRLGMARVPARVSLRTPDGRAVATVGRGPKLTVTAEPSELLLFVFGRNEVQAEFVGDDDTIAAVKAAKRGV